jgi:NAD(P)-dependent dehydrogenase (short-subunit alcohol dehydrogenase family)
VRASSSEASRSGVSVRRFAAEGAIVAAAARREGRITALAAELREAGSEALAVRCDVTDEASVARAVDEVVSTFGRLDGAFNNAGVGGTHRPLHETGTADFDRVLAALFLLSDESRWTTGTVFPCEGGITAR